jgi:hypothetical protein
MGRKSKKKHEDKRQRNRNKGKKTREGSRIENREKIHCNNKNTR